MRIFEPFVGLPEVAVGVDVQDTERRMPPAEGADQPVGGRMVAADQPHRLARIEPARSLLLDVGVHRRTSLVHAPQLAHDVFVVGRTAALEVVDHPRGIDPQPLRRLLQGIVHVGRGDAAAPGPGGQRIVEVELRRSLDDRIGGIGRTGTVGDRHVPGGRNKHQFRRLGIERKTEIGPVVHADAVRIEGFLFHISRFK